MEWFEALLMGLLQGFTEFLPVSSSGHITILSNLFGIEGEENLTFTIVVHVAAQHAVHTLERSGLDTPRIA